MKRGFILCCSLNILTAPICSCANPDIENDPCQIFQHKSLPYEIALIMLEKELCGTSTTEMEEGNILDEKESIICFQEELLPELIKMALKHAYLQALASGYSVILAEGEALIELHPDGTKTFIKPLPPSFHCSLNTAVQQQ